MFYSERIVSQSLRNETALYTVWVSAKDSILYRIGKTLIQCCEIKNVSNIAKICTNVPKTAKLRFESINMIYYAN